MSVLRDQALADTLGRAEAEREQELLLIERAMLGEASAFRGLVERHQRGIHGLVSRLVANTTEGDDLVQETFARAYCALEQFDPRYRFSTWLYRIALNLCRDYRKSAKRREYSVGLDVEHGIDDSMVQASHEFNPDGAARVARLRRALGQLGPKDREVIVLKDLQELSYDEIHDITGTPITALKIRASRARTRLQLLMQGDGDGP